MARAEPSIDEVLTRLGASPARIAECSAGLAQPLAQANPAGSEWSANEVLAHLRACADVWGGCIATILAEDGPTLRAVNPRAWVNQTDYFELDFPTSLQSFASQRAELLATLAPLSLQAWSRSAVVIGAGAPLHRTVLFYAEWLARHERPHLKQLERAVSATRA